MTQSQLREHAGTQKNANVIRHFPTNALGPGKLNTLQQSNVKKQWQCSRLYQRQNTCSVAGMQRGARYAQIY